MKSLSLLSLPLLLPAGLLLAGCTTVVEPAATLKTSTSVNGVEVTSVVYECSTKLTDSESQGKFESHFLVEHFSQDKVMLVTREASYPLIRIESASGEKYASVAGAEEFWSKGDSAMIKVNNIRYTQCVIKNDNN